MQEFSPKIVAFPAFLSRWNGRLRFLFAKTACVGDFTLAKVRAMVIVAYSGGLDILITLG
jgi:hypothetical protein